MIKPLINNGKNPADLLMAYQLLSPPIVSLTDNARAALTPRGGTPAAGLMPLCVTPYSFLGHLGGAK